MIILIRIIIYYQLILSCMQNEVDILICQICTTPIMIKCYEIHRRACEYKSKSQIKSTIKESNVNDLIPCLQCGDTIHFEKYATHMEECVGRQLTKCVMCKLLYPSFLYEEHVNICNDFREEEQDVNNHLSKEDLFEQQNDHQLTEMIMDLAQSTIRTEEPLSLQIIQKMKKVVLDKTEDCSICYCSISKSSCVLRLNCSHHFHVRCMTAWLQKNPNCPMCRHHALF